MFHQKVEILEIEGKNAKTTVFSSLSQKRQPKRGENTYICLKGNFRINIIKETNKN